MKPIDLQIEQEVVDQIIIDYQVSLKLSDGSYFMFECKFTLTKPDGTAFEITPATPRNSSCTFLSCTMHRSLEGLS